MALYLLEMFSEITTQLNNGQISTFLLWQLLVFLFDKSPETFKHVLLSLFYCSFPNDEGKIGVTF